MQYRQLGSDGQYCIKHHMLSKKNFMNDYYDFRCSCSLFRLQRQDGEGNSGTLWRSLWMAIDRNKSGALPDAALLLLYHQVKKRQSKWHKTKMNRVIIS